MLTLVLLGAGHVFMVFAVDPQSLRSMVTGDYDESRSPEALNARPFLRGRPKPVLTIATPAHPSAPMASTPTGIHPPEHPSVGSRAATAASTSPEAVPA